MNKRLPLAALAAASVLLLGGCVVAPAGRPVYREPVIVAPPPPRAEYPGPAPAVGYVWIGGYWSWVGGRHEWAPGHWEAPRPGYNWVPHRWEREGDHWQQHGGRWEEDRRGRGDYREHDRGRDHDGRDHDGRDHDRGRDRDRDRRD